MDADVLFVNCEIKLLKNNQQEWIIKEKKPRYLPQFKLNMYQILSIFIFLPTYKLSV